MKDEFMKKLRDSYAEKKTDIRARLGEFKEIYQSGTDEKLFEELCFCIFTAGASAKMGVTSVEASREILVEGSLSRLKHKLKGVHRFHNKRPEYVIHTRDYLQREHGFKIRDLIFSKQDPIERRDFLAKNKNIKGIGYKEASHFLRNIGFSGYCILDKHILVTMHEIGLIKSSKPPGKRDDYLKIEKKLLKFSDEVGIHIDELDLLLWSEKTGEILK